MRSGILVWLELMRRNEIILWQSPQHSITPKQRIKSLRYNSWRRETLCTVCQLFLVKSVLQNIGKNIVKKFRLSRITERFVKEREKKGPTLGSEHRGGQSSRSPNALSYEQLGSGVDFFEEHMASVRKKKHGTCARTYLMSEGLTFKCVKNLSTSQQDNSRHSCRISVRLRT